MIAAHAEDDELHGPVAQLASRGIQRLSKVPPIAKRGGESVKCLPISAARWLLQ